MTTIQHSGERATLAELNDRQIATLQAIRSLRGPCTTAQLADILGRDPGRDLKRLTATGLVTSSGNTRARRYTATGKSRAQTGKPGALSDENERREHDGILRVKVLDVLRRDPSARSTGRLAQLTLRAPDEIERAVLDLIGQGRVHRGDDGTLAALTLAEDRARRRAQRRR